jgi:hypothetical protein
MRSQNCHLGEPRNVARALVMFGLPVSVPHRALNKSGSPTVASSLAPRERKDQQAIFVADYEPICGMVIVNTSDAKIPDIIAGPMPYPGKVVWPARNRPGI